METKVANTHFSCRLPVCLPKLLTQRKPGVLGSPVKAPAKGFAGDIASVLLSKQQKSFAAGEVIKKGLTFASFLRENEKTIIRALTRYETYEVASDEIRRCLDLFSHLSENEEYFNGEKVNSTVVFLPRNQPLYALSCFGIVPSLQSNSVSVRPPVSMHGFFEELISVIHLREFFPNVEVCYEQRELFIERHAKLSVDSSGKKAPVTDVVIFTGTMENADELRQKFSPHTLLIANGAGHNPVVVASNADLDKAAESVARLQLYNQGQDCANPSAILVHSSVQEIFLRKLKERINEAPVGRYAEYSTRVGPVTEVKDLKRIQALFVDNASYIDRDTPGKISTLERIVYPTIINKPLKEGPNFVEQFAPVFFVQSYEQDAELDLYFGHPKYERNAMYVTVFGSSRYIDNLPTKKFICGRFLHPGSTIIRDTDLHAPGVERGTKPYGGYGRGASCTSYLNVVEAKPTCPQRDICEFLKLRKLQEMKKQLVQKSAKNRSLNRKIELPADMKFWWRDLGKVVKKAQQSNEYGVFVEPIGFGQVSCMRILFTLEAIKKSQNDNAPILLILNDQQSFKEDLALFNPDCYGKPINEVPDILGIHVSIYEKIALDYLSCCEKMGIKVSPVRHSDLYKNDNFVEKVIQYIDEFSGKSESDLDQLLVIRSRYTHKVNTRIIHYDQINKCLSYECLETGKIDTIEMRGDKGLFYLRAGHEKAVVIDFLNIGVVGTQRNDASEKTIESAANLVFQRSGQDTVVIPVGFAAIQGKNKSLFWTSDYPMSALLEIYPIEVLRWCFAASALQQKLQIGLHSQALEIHQGYLNFLNSKKKADLTLQRYLNTDKVARSYVPISELLALGELSDWNPSRVRNHLALNGVKHNFFSDQEFFALEKWASLNAFGSWPMLKTKNVEYWSKLPMASRKLMKKLSQDIDHLAQGTVEQIQAKLFEVKMACSGESGAKFFEDFYQLVYSKKNGPRLGKLLSLGNIEKIKKLLA